jgi:hypothetical protein
LPPSVEPPYNVGAFPVTALMVPHHWREKGRYPMVTRFTLFAAVVLHVVRFAAAEEPQPAKLHQINMCVPIPQLTDRFGKDAKPVSMYIKALEKRAGEILAKEKQLSAKGLLIAVGIKSKADTRVWCEAVDGDMPEELLQQLETELAKIEAVDLKVAPAAFGVEINLFGQKPEKFPEFPKSWVDAAKKSKTALVPPDDLFKTIWPGQPSHAD